MAVLVTDEIPGMTQDMYDRLHHVLEEPSRNAPGFIAHAAGPIDGGWQITELWESQNDRDTFLEKHVTSLAPAGSPLPKTTVRQIASFTIC